MIRLDLRLFAKEIKRKRGDRSLRAVKKEIPGVSFPTLSRLERGKMPDVNTFLRVCDWLDYLPSYFVKR